MKRRVLVAQALVHKPPVIVLDEPTAGVDVELRQTLWQFVRRLNRDGHTIVLTTHYLEEAGAVRRIAMLKAGPHRGARLTRNLLGRFSAASSLRLRRDRCPALLQRCSPARRCPGRPDRAAARRLAALERALARLREAGSARRDGARAAGSRGGVPAAHRQMA
jgi:ABC-2 type transport system ATP-binding protein